MNDPSNNNWVFLQSDNEKGNGVPIKCSVENYIECISKDGGNL